MLKDILHTDCYLLRFVEDAGMSRGVIKMASQIYAKEGLLAFWTGLGAYVGRTAPHAMIILLSTEPVVYAYRTLLHHE